MEYLDDSEVDFSSDDDEEDMEDFEGGDDEKLAAGQSQLGKRPAGIHSVHPKHACLCLSGAFTSLMHARMDRVCLHTSSRLRNLLC